LHYRKEIDGLRAIAILPVIWTHSGLPSLAGGFLGVDVFFVISGFLITSILLREFESDKFSLLTFYERRARRILPALMVVIIITSICVPLVSDQPKYISDYGASVLSTILFSSNIYFWQTSGYFGSTSELAPMLHTWSLAVEEQYYIFFPLLMMLLFPVGKRVLVSAIVIISVISLLIAQWGALNSPIANFYLLPSRAWQLMAGALAAMIYANTMVISCRGKYSGVFAILGMTLILLSYMLFNPTTLHPTSLTILPVLGTVFVLVFATENNIVGRLLSTKLLHFTGLISYSLYLWHQPILALMKKSLSNHLAPLEILIAVTSIFLVSYLSWKFVEAPFRSKAKFDQRRVFKLSVSAMCIGVCCSLVFMANLKLQTILVPDNMARYETMLTAQHSQSNQVMFDDGCKFWSKEFNLRFTNRFDKCAKRYGKAIFILGGSHGMDLYNAIAMNAKNPFIVSVSRGFCRAHQFIGGLKHQPHCQYQDFKEFAKKHQRDLSYVVYTQTPYRLFTVTPLHNASINDLSVVSVDQVVSYLADLKQNYGVDVIMIGMMPSLMQSPIDWGYHLPFENQLDTIVSDNAILLSRHLDQLFDKKLSHYHIPYISKFDGFTLDVKRDLIINGEITYSDKTHISAWGEKIFGRRLIKHLTSEGYREFNNIKGSPAGQ